MSADDWAAPLFAVDRSFSPTWLEDIKPMTREELMAAFEEGAARLLAQSLNPPPPCGWDAEHPHIVAPGGKTGDVRRCVQCGTVGTLP